MSLDVSEVKEIIAEALFVEPETVDLDSSLIDDLGAESIDFIDIIFQLEQKYNVKLPRGEIYDQAQRGFGEGEFEIKGTIQSKGLERLRELLPNVRSDRIREGLTVRDIPSLYTVQTFVSMIERQMGQSSMDQSNQLNDKRA